MEHGHEGRYYQGYNDGHGQLHRDSHGSSVLERRGIDGNYADKEHNDATGQACDNYTASRLVEDELVKR